MDGVGGLAGASQGQSTRAYLTPERTEPCPAVEGAAGPSAFERTMADLLQAGRLLEVEGSGFVLVQ